MDIEILVQNIKSFCASKGTTPTAACEASGAGRNFMDNLKKGSIPSVAKVQLVADYLGVTTSELLGEKIEPGANAGPPSENELIFRSLPPALQEEALRYMRYLAQTAAQQQQEQKQSVEE